MDWISAKLLATAANNWVFILDNASFHQRKDIKDAVISAGYTLLFQPTYCPDLNQVENKWLISNQNGKKKTLMSTPYSNARPIYDHFIME